MLASTVSVPIYGKLSDIYGRRPFFVLGIVLFMAGAVVSGAAQSMTMLIAGRAIQGLGAGGLIPLAMAATTQFFRSVGGTVGVTAMGALLTAGLQGGPAPGSLLAGAAGTATDAYRTALAEAMHTVFVACVPLIGLAFLATLLIEGRELRRTAQPDRGHTGEELFDELGAEFEEQPAVAR